MLSLMFNPPSIMQLDIIMEFSIDTLEDIVVLFPILAFGPILAPFPILQFLPIMDGLMTVSYTHLTLPTILLV